jgi:hypothetical protein
MGGSATVENRPAGGAHFTVTCPRWQQSDYPLPMPSQPEPREQRGDSRPAVEETHIRETLSANLAEGLALSEFASTLPEPDRMSDSEVVKAFRAAQRDRERED